MILSPVNETRHGATKDFESYVPSENYKSPRNRDYSGKAICSNSEMAAEKQAEVTLNQLLTVETTMDGEP